MIQIIEGRRFRYEYSNPRVSKFLIIYIYIYTYKYSLKHTPKK